MTRNETRTLIASIASMFPNFKLADDLSLMIDTWHMVLEDEDYLQIQRAFKSFCKTSTTGFAPTPGQLIALIQDRTEPYASTADEAWTKVLMAARDANYHAPERYEEFDDITKMCVGSPANLSAMALLDEMSLTTVIRSQFVKEYRRLEEMFRKEHRDTADVQREINDNRARMREALSLARLNTDQLMIEGE